MLGQEVRRILGCFMGIGLEIAKTSIKISALLLHFMNLICHSEVQIRKRSCAILPFKISSFPDRWVLFCKTLIRENYFCRISRETKLRRPEFVFSESLLFCFSCIRFF